MDLRTRSRPSRRREAADIPLPAGAHRRRRRSRRASRRTATLALRLARHRRDGRPPTPRRPPRDRRRDARRGRADRAPRRARASSRRAACRRQSPSTPATTVDAGADAEMVVQVRQTLRDVAVAAARGRRSAAARAGRRSRSSTRRAAHADADRHVHAGRRCRATRARVDDVLAQTAPPQVLRRPGVPERRRRADGVDARLGRRRRRASTWRGSSRRRTSTARRRWSSPGIRRDSTRRITMIMRVGIDDPGDAAVTPGNVEFVQVAHRR